MKEGVIRLIQASSMCSLEKVEEISNECVLKCVLRFHHQVKEGVCSSAIRHAHLCFFEKIEGIIDDCVLCIYKAG